MPVVPVIIAPQRLIALLGIQLNWCRPFIVRVIPNEKEESVVGNVQRGKLGRFPLSLTAPGSAYGSYSGSLSARAAPLWSTCYFGR